MKTGWSSGTPVIPRLIVLLMLAGAVFVSCYPGDITDIAQLDTVVTLFDDTFPFSEQSTYSMPDSVFHVCEVVDNPPSDCIPLSRVNDAFILSTVREQMTANGWEELPMDDSQGIPDVRLAVIALGSESTTWYAWNPWNPWYPGGGWWYPPVWTPVTTQKGTLALNMAIADSMITIPGAGSGPPVVWGAVLNGALESGSAANTRSRLQNGITQMYNQSPYLNIEGSTP